ncbi:MAG: hypothetical protein RLY20_2756 [Verrucomicrobiota bacterium]|jgi:uncharacterized membrane protein
MENKSLFARWRANFFTGLAVSLPALVTIAIVKWLFGTISSFTDGLLFFLPQSWTHADKGNGSMYWYWSLAALVLAVILITLAGLLARYYIGIRLIAWLDAAMLRVPLLNKIYSTIKQVNEAFSSGNKTAFKTVVMVEFPSPGSHSVGFITSDQNELLASKTGERMVNVFIPTTPNPTSGFLIVVPASKVTKLDMSVADGIKYIISLGALSPDAPKPN